MRTAAAILTVLLMALSLPAQQPRTSESIEVSIVNVDVVVTDAKGRRVTGLTANDFEIREGGKTRPIAQFAEHRPDADVESRPPRTVVVLLERSPMNDQHVVELYDAVRKLLRETITGPADRAAVIAWSGGAIIRQPFSNSIAVLESALERMQREHEAVWRDRAAEAALRDAAAAQADVATEKIAAAMTPVDDLDLATHQLARVRRKVPALEALLNSMGAIEGRKILVLGLHARGLMDDIAGMESVTTVRRRAVNATLHQPVIRAANASGVAIYPIYPRGGARAIPRNSAVDDPVGGPPAQNVNFVEVLEELSNKTGGRMAWGSSDIAAMLPRAAEDVQSYYSLGYTTAPSGKDATRAIEVRAKNRAHKVRARTQAVDKSDQTAIREQLVANLYHGLGAVALPVEIEVSERTGGRVQVRVTTEGKARPLSFYVVAGSPVGVASEVLTRTQTLPVADFTLEVDGNADQISAGVVDEGTKEFGTKRVPLP
ncbi:MAG TPA: VWA domain-containing protein [Thermoanaerobaculia bacterium]|jgi:VWFA-related protein